MSTSGDSTGSCYGTGSGSGSGGDSSESMTFVLGPVSNVVSGIWPQAQGEIVGSKFTLGCGGSGSGHGFDSVWSQ